MKVKNMILFLIATLFVSCHDPSSSEGPKFSNVAVEASLDKIHITWDAPAGIEGTDKIRIQIWSSTMPFKNTDDYSNFSPYVTTEYINEEAGVSFLPNSFAVTESIVYSLDSTAVELTLDEIDYTNFPNSMMMNIKSDSGTVYDEYYIANLWADYEIQPDAYEPNDEIDSSTPLTLNTPYYITLNSSDKNDWFSFPVLQDTCYSIGINAGAVRYDYSSYQSVDFWAVNSAGESVFFSGSGMGYTIDSEYRSYASDINETMYFNLSEYEVDEKDEILYIQSYTITSDNFESNESPAAATLIVPGDTLTGSLHSFSDIDYFKFSAVSGVTYTISMSGNDTAPNWFINTSHTLTGLSEFILYSTDLSVEEEISPYFGYDWSCPDTGIYYIKISDALGTYSLTIE